MFYLIQKNIWSEPNYDMIVETLDRFNFDYEICAFVPFVHEIEFETKRKDVWCFGSVKMAHVANKYGFVPGSMYNDNHDFEVYSKYYKENMLNSDSFIMDFTDEIPVDTKYEMFFARPTKDSKFFSGMVFMRYSWYEMVEDFKSRNLIIDERKILISTLKEIHQEIRCWVVGGKIISMSQYKLGNRITYKNLDNYDTEAYDFASKMIDIYQPAKAFVLDICRTKNGFKIVEINCINCAGFYDVNFQKLLMSLENEFND